MAKVIRIARATNGGFTVVFTFNLVFNGRSIRVFVKNLQKRLSEVWKSRLFLLLGFIARVVGAFKNFLTAIAAFELLCFLSSEQFQFLGAFETIHKIASTFSFLAKMSNVERNELDGQEHLRVSRVLKYLNEVMHIIGDIYFF